MVLSENLFEQREPGDRSLHEKRAADLLCKGHVFTLQAGVHEPCFWHILHRVPAGCQGVKAEYLVQEHDCGRAGVDVDVLGVCVLGDLGRGKRRKPPECVPSELPEPFEATELQQCDDEDRVDGSGRRGGHCDGGEDVVEGEEGVGGRDGGWGGLVVGGLVQVLAR